VANPGAVLRANPDNLNILRLFALVIIFVFVFVFVVILVHILSRGKIVQLSRFAATAGTTAWTFLLAEPADYTQHVEAMAAAQNCSSCLSRDIGKADSALCVRFGHLASCSLFVAIG
jgi:hypothetical protein